MKGNSFCNVAAATIVSEHSFASTLATGRPDERDKEKIRRFANQVADRLKEGKHLLLEVPGANPPEKYYTPLKADGTPAKFLKAVPQTNLEKCIHCGACVDVCPMGVVHKEHPEITTGACIKCQACIHICDSQARCFDDEDFLSHRQMLKENYTGRKESEFFF
jgi:ferredoxin